MEKAVQSLDHAAKSLHFLFASFHFFPWLSFYRHYSQFMKCSICHINLETIPILPALNISKQFPAESIA